MVTKVLGLFKKLFRRGTSASILLVGSGLLTGCATLGLEQTKPPVTVSEVIRMTNEGVPAENIIARMRDGKNVYRLNAVELAQLHDRGVADPVLNYMQKTYLEAVRREQSRADWDDRMMWGDHFW